jgi:hypothetical protein
MPVAVISFLPLRCHIARVVVWWHRFAGVLCRCLVPVGRHPAGSPAIPEPGPRTRRHPGVPAGLPFTPRAVTLDHLHRQGDAPTCGRHDGRGRQRTTAIQEDPVGGR